MVNTVCIVQSFMFYKDITFLFKICSFKTYRNSVVFHFYLHDLGDYTVVGSVTGTWHDLSAVLSTWSLVI